MTPPLGFGARRGPGGAMTPRVVLRSAPLPRNWSCRQGRAESPLPPSIKLSGSESSMVRGFWQSLDFLRLQQIRIDPRPIKVPARANRRCPPSKARQRLGVGGNRSDCQKSGEEWFVHEDHALTQAFWQASRKGATLAVSCTGWHMTGPRCMTSR